MGIGTRNRHTSECAVCELFRITITAIISVGHIQNLGKARLLQKRLVQESESEIDN